MLEAAAVDGDRLERMLARRVVGEPLEQVLGWAEFCGLRIAVAPGVFVPRRRTEPLVERAVQLLSSSTRPVVVDLCCGTGAIGVAIAGRLEVELHAADLDHDAVTCARQNVRMGEVHEGDLYDALPAGLRGRVDLLAVNAPYVPTDEIRLMPPEARLHEHHVALDGGPDGLDLHRRVAAGCPGVAATRRDPAHRDQPRAGGWHGRGLRHGRAPAHDPQKGRDHAGGGGSSSDLFTSLITSATSQPIQTRLSNIASTNHGAKSVSMVLKVSAGTDVGAAADRPA